MSIDSKKLISVVMPAFNESDGIQNSIRIVAKVFDGLRYRYELIVVDDGSPDTTFDQAAAMVDAGFNVRAVRLSRNFGKEGGLLAGLELAQGDAVITIDADLQHPPALIPQMILAWEEGAKIVHGIKRDRGDESRLSTIRAAWVNALITGLGGIDVRNSSDFKLLDRAAVTALTKLLPERKRFYRGLADWVGFTQVSLEFDVAAREYGTSGWSLKSLFALALTALVSFTSLPLRVVTVLGLLTFLLGIGVGGDALWSWKRGMAIPGYLTVIITLLLIGSFIMISLGIIGEYIAKIYQEVKRRPCYVVDRIYEPDSCL